MEIESLLWALVPEMKFRTLSNPIPSMFIAPGKAYFDFMAPSIREAGEGREPGVCPKSQETIIFDTALKL